MNIRRMARAIAWTVAGLMALAVAKYVLLLAVNWRDEPASGHVRRFERMHGQRPRGAPEEDALGHLLGMAAAPRQDPIGLGVARLA